MVDEHFSLGFQRLGKMHFYIHDAVSLPAGMLRDDRAHRSREVLDRLFHLVRDQLVRLLGDKSSIAGEAFHRRVAVEAAAYAERSGFAALSNAGARERDRDRDSVVVMVRDMIWG